MQEKSEKAAHIKRQFQMNKESVSAVIEGKAMAANGANKQGSMFI